MEEELKVGDFCFYIGSYNTKRVLVRVVDVRKDFQGWTHKIQPKDPEQGRWRFWIHPRTLESIGRDESDLMRDLDSVGLL